MEKRGRKEKETICWECQNYLHCSWSDGIPVKGWKATPTAIINNGNPNNITDSFLVEDCPHFKQDKKRRVLVKEMADKLGFSEKTLYRRMKDKGRMYIKTLFKQKGYKLYVYKEEKTHSYYLEKINDT